MAILGPPSYTSEIQERQLVVSLADCGQTGPWKGPELSRNLCGLRWEGVCWGLMRLPFNLEAEQVK